MMDKEALLFVGCFSILLLFLSNKHTKKVSNKHTYTHERTRAHTHTQNYTNTKTHLYSHTNKNKIKQKKHEKS